MKIGTKMFLLFFLVAVTPTVIHGFVHKLVVEDAFQRRIGNSLHIVAEEKANAVTGLLRDRIREVKGLAKWPHVLEALHRTNRTYDGRSDDEIRQSMARIDKTWINTKAQSAIAQERIGNELSQLFRDYITIAPEAYGEILVTDVRGGTVAMSRPLTDFNQADEGWWQDAFAGDREFVRVDDRGYDLSVGAGVIGVAVPVIDQGVKIGVLKVNFLTTDFINIVSTSGAGHPEWVSLVRSDGTAVAGAHAEQDHLHLSPENLQAVESGATQDWIETTHAERKVIASSAVVTVPLLVRQTPPSAQKGISGEIWQPTTWSVLVETDMVHAFKPIEQLKLATYYFIIATLALIFLLAYLASRSFTAPVLRIRKGMQRVGEGDLAHRVSMGRADELGDLARAFDIMTERLQETMARRDSLEQAQQRLIEERQKAQESEERLNLILNSTMDGIYAIDRDGICYMCNPSAVRLLGYQNDDQIIGQNAHSLFHHSYADGTPFSEQNCKISKSYRQGTTIQEHDDVFWKQDGSSFRVSYTAHPILHNDTIVGAVCSFIDISDRIEAEKALRQSQKMESLGNLAGGIAHDVNNMLLPIILLSGKVLAELEVDSRAYRRLQKITEAATKAQSLIAGILTFSRRSDEEPKLEKTSLQDAVRNTLEFLQSTFPSTITIRTDLPAEPLEVEIDISQFTTVLLNLASNAVDAMEGHVGELKFAASRMVIDGALSAQIPNLSAQEAVLLTVSDTGCGMDEQTLVRIFDPFFTTKEVGEGTGLGMAMVHGIIAKHHGAITVSSVVGEGTTFSIYFPLVTEPPAEA